VIAAPGEKEITVKSAIVLTSTAALLLLGACKSTPQRVEQLEQARAEVETLAQDPMASQAAPQELQAARSALDQANEALANKRPVEEVAHLSYVAERNAEIGKARIQEAQARQMIAQGEAERNRVLLEAREAQLKQAQSELSDLQAQKTQRGMVLTLGDVLFDTGKAALKPGAAERLDRLAGYLSENPGTRIIIEGHTDSTGSEAFNEELSRRRAQAVADALVSRGVASDRFEVVGRGPAAPVANNATAAGRQQNRRVEIVFSDQSGRFAQGEGGTLRR
jgi:outer membrane protein OmpA-like peptidoglycan-associated protein